MPKIIEVELAALTRLTTTRVIEVPDDFNVDIDGEDLAKELHEALGGEEFDQEDTDYWEKGTSILRSPEPDEPIDPPTYRWNGTALEIICSPKTYKTPEVEDSQSFYEVQAVVSAENAIGGKAYWTAISDDEGHQRFSSREAADNVYARAKLHYGKEPLRLVYFQAKVIEL